MWLVRLVIWLATGTFVAMMFLPLVRAMLAWFTDPGPFGPP